MTLSICVESVGIISGTGPAGVAVGTRLASLGVQVLIGSRDEDRSKETVRSISTKYPHLASYVRGGTNKDAANQQLVVVSTPWDVSSRAITGLESELSGKAVICMSNALTRVGAEFQPLIPSRGSAAQTLQSALPRSSVVAALQHVPARELEDIAESLRVDILVCGDDQIAKDAVISLLSRIDGSRVLDAGSLASAGPIEAMTAVLLNLNQKYKTRSAIRITGIES